MNLKKWCREVHSKAAIPQVDFPREYLKIVPAIREAITAFQGVKTDVRYHFGAEAVANLKAALILSDFMSVYPMGGESVTWALQEDSSPNSPKTVRVSRDFAEQLYSLNNRPVIRPGYVCRNDDRIKDFLRQVEPLAKAGRLMVRPVPMVMGLQKVLDGLHAKQKGRLVPVERMWGVQPVDPNSPAEHWLALDVKERQDAIPLKEGEADSKLETKICSIVLPYIEGVSFAELSKILDAEGDCLAEFRSSVRKVISEVREDSSQATDIVNDVVRPATDKIERRFKSISKIHRLKMAGACVSTATLSLLALTSNGVGASLASLLGASGLGLIAKERSDFLKGKAELKEMPFYLLWRLQRSSRQ